MRVGIFVLLVLFIASAHAQVANPKKLKPRVLPGFSSGLVTFELSLRNASSEMLSMRAVDPQSKATAQLVFDKSALEQGLYRGVFDIRLSNSKAELNRLEYYDLKGKKYFSKVVSNSDMTLVVLFEYEADLRAFEAQPPEMVNLRLEALAALERESQLEEMNRMSAKEREARAQKAKALAARGLQSFKAAQYAQAVAYFSEASRLDPSDATYVYQHGVSLYRLKQYNKSLAMLSIAEGSEINQTEKRYYIAHNNMKLKNNEKALKGFSEVAEEKDPVLSPLSSFFAGFLEYQNKNYTKSRRHFEKVIDTSKDPRLDREAEKMLDALDQQETLEAANREILKYTFFFGPVYDSNVLNIATSASATDVKAMRANYGGSIKANIMRGKKWEWGAEVSVNDYYSTTTSFASDSTLQAADALELSVASPVKFGGEWEVTPSYQSVYLAPNGGTRSLAISSTVLDVANTRLISPSWILVSKLQGAQDTSKLTISSDNDDQTGTRMSLGLSFVRLLDIKGDTAVTADVSYAKNQTKGVNYRSSRPSLGVSYVFPGLWTNPAMTRLEYSQQAFSEATTTRTDKVIVLSATQTKKINRSWDFNFGLQVTNSQSEVDAYKYDKYMLSALFTYSGSILKGDKNKE